MTFDGKHGIPRVRPGPIRWLSTNHRNSIRKTVSEYHGYNWKIESEKDLSEFACHHCGIISDGSLDIFFKYSEATDAEPQFEAEISGLRTLAKLAEVLVPQPIGIVKVETATVLIMEALVAIKRGSHQWRQIGKTLADIHRAKGDSYGFDSNGYHGPLPQDNRSTPSWTAFFRERRLLPMLSVAVDSGHLPSSMASRIEKLVTRLPDLCGPDVTPTLLHGDAQQNNFISTAQGTFVIDPAIYYGNPEMDLALVDSFQPVPTEVFEGYRDKMPINPGFHERRDLWRIPLYLGAVAIEGPTHLDRLVKALQRYL